MERLGDLIGRVLLSGHLSQSTSFGMVKNRQKGEIMHSGGTSMPFRMLGAIALAVCWTVFAFGQNPFVSATALDGPVLANKMAGYGIDFVEFQGFPSSVVGIVSNLNEVAIPFTNGIYLTTGNAQKNVGTNEVVVHYVGNPETGQNTGISVSAWHSLLANEHGVPNSFTDSAGIELIVTPEYSTLNMGFALISEEFYRLPGDYDKFGIFVSQDGSNWTNLARIISQDGDWVPAGMDTINQNTNQHHFLSNVATNELGHYILRVAPPQIPLYMTCNGAIKRITASVRLTPSQETRIRVIVADYTDRIGDTTLLLDEYGLTSGADIRVDVTASAAATNFTVTVSNPGPVDASEIVVTNFFPIGLTLAQTNHSANVRDWQTFGTTNVFVITSLPRGASEVIRLDCAAVSTGSYTNRAVAWPSEGDHAPVNNDDDDVLEVTLLGSADLTLGKTVVSGLVSGQAYTVRGTNLTYAVVVTNRGDGATGSGWILALTDTLPTGVVLAGGSATNWAIPTLAAGQIWSTNLTVTVTAGAPTSLTNRCTLLYGASGSEETLEAECVTPVRPDADLVIRLSASTNRVGWMTPPSAPGREREYGYTVSVSNAGPNLAQNVKLERSAAPANLTILDGALDVTFDLAAGATSNFTVTAYAATSLVGRVTYEVRCESEHTHDPDMLNNAAEVDVDFDPISDLRVSVNWIGADPMPGNVPVRVNVAVLNNGPSPAPGVRLAVTLPGPVTTNVMVGALAWGDVPSYTFWVLPAVGATSLTAQATVSTTGIESDVTNNQAEDTTGLLWPDVSVSLTDTPDPVASAGTLTYTVRVQAAGAAVTGIVTEVTLPPEVMQVLADGGGTPIAGGLRFGPVALAAGAHSEWVIDVQAPSALTQAVIRATATATSPAGDTDPANNTAMAETTVARLPPADLQTAVSWQPVGPAAGATNTSYQVKVDVSNLSAASATNVTLTVWLDTAPAVLALPVGWIAEGALTARWAQAVAMLPASGSTSVTFNVTLTDVTPSLIARARVAANNDETPANNEALATLELLWPDVRVTLADLTDPVNSGAVFAYRLTVSAERAAVSDVMAELKLPVAFGVEDAAGGVPISGGLLFGPLSLAAGGSTNWTVGVRAPVVVSNTWLTAVASITPPLGDTNATNDAEAETTRILPPLPADVQAVIFWQPAGPSVGGTNTSYLLYAAVTNASSETATNVLLTAWLDPSPAAFAAPAGWMMTGALTACWSQAVGTLPPGASTGAWFSVTLTNVAAGLTARARVESLYDDVPANNQALATLELLWPDVRVALDDLTDPVNSGAVFAYRLTVSADHAAVSNVTAELRLPVALAVEDAAGGVPISGGLLFGPLSLAAGGSTNWTVGVRAPMVVSNTWLMAVAAITPPLGDTDATNDAESETTLILPPPPADVQAVVFWQPAGASAGGTNTSYLLYAAVTNSSAETATNVLLTAWLDPSPAAFAAPAGWMMTGALTARWSQVVGTLPPGASTGAWFSVTLTDVAPGLTARARVESLYDDVPANNQALATLELLWPDLRVTIQPNPAQVTEGDTVDFTVTVWNDGNAPAVGIWVTNAYPAYVTVTNAGGGVVSDGTNVCFHGLTVPAAASTSLTVRVRADTIPAGVTSLVTTAHCLIPVGDATPLNNAVRREIPLYGRSVTGGMVWMLDHSTGTFFAGLTLTNSSATVLQSVWFAFADRLTPSNTTQSALWSRADGAKVADLFGDGSRYVDLTAAVQAALLAAGGDAAWDPGEVVRIGVSAATWAGGGTVVPHAERLLEMYDRNRQNPALFVNLDQALGSRPGTFHHDSGIDADGNFRVSEIELAAARTAWLDGRLSDEEYLFLSAANRAQGYKWDMERQQWVVIK